jgi:hypothetical protein
MGVQFHYNSTALRKKIGGDGDGADRLAQDAI